MTVFNYAIIPQDPQANDGTEVRSINDSGDIVGFYYDDSYGNNSQNDDQTSFLYNGTAFTDIANPLVGEYSVDSYYYNYYGYNYYYNYLTGAALDINDSGAIVGYYEDSSGQEHGFIDTAGHFTPLTDPGAYWTEATGINNNGEVVGSFANSTGAYGFIYNGQYVALSVPGSSYTYAQGINDTGVVVGYYDNNNYADAFVYSGAGVPIATFSAPGAYDTYAMGINNSGWIVGYYYANDAEHGFLDVNGTFSNIDVPGATSTYVTGISNDGQIVGYYYDLNGEHSFRADDHAADDRRHRLFIECEPSTRRFQRDGDADLQRSGDGDRQ